MLGNGKEMFEDGVVPLRGRRRKSCVEPADREGKRGLAARGSRCFVVNRGERAEGLTEENEKKRCGG